MAEPAVTPRSILARLRRGFVRIGERVAGWFGRRPRRRVTEHQRETARETGVMLGLLRETAAAGGQMTDEQRMLLARSLPGMRAREAVLLQIPNRSLVEENELQMIRREMAVIEGRPDAPAGWVSRPPAGRSSGLLGSVSGFLGGWQAYALVGVFALSGWGVAAVQSALKERVEHQRNEARHERDAAQRALQEAREVAQELAQAVRAADALSQQTAANLEAERARRARAAAIERRRQREIQDVLTGRDPPAWRLRDDGSGEAGADSGGAAVGDPG